MSELTPVCIKVESPMTQTQSCRYSFPRALPMPCGEEMEDPMQSVVSMTERGGTALKGVAADIAGRMQLQLLDNQKVLRAGSPGRESAGGLEYLSQPRINLCPRTFSLIIFAEYSPIRLKSSLSSHAMPRPSADPQ